MTATSERLLTDVLELPEGERADLALHLIQSLAPPAGTQSDEDWVAEVERRARAAMAGEPGVTWDTARSDIERRLRRE